MSSHTFETVVVGLGAVGSAAVYHLARRGVRVLGLDLHSPPHHLGASHGESRIVRRAYFEGNRYLPLLARSWMLWRELETTSGHPLITACGSLNIGRAHRPIVTQTSESAAALDIPHTVLSPAELRNRFPAFRVPDGSLAVLDIEAGLIAPEAAIRAHLQLAAGHGATLYVNEPVLDWTAVTGGDAKEITVTTPRTTYRANALVVTVGGWVNDLLGDLGLPMTVERVTNAWFEPPTTGSTAPPEHLTPDRCPVFIWEYEDDRIMYGFPDLGRGVKAGLHYEGTVVGHPDDVDRDTLVDDVDARRIRVVLERLLPDAVGAVKTTDVCFYTNTADKHYLVDRHPEHRQVVYASTCSGHGFKTSPAVGEALADLVMERTPQVDLATFRYRW